MWSWQIPVPAFAPLPPSPPPSIGTCSSAAQRRAAVARTAKTGRSW